MTVIQSGSGLAPVQYSDALMAMVPRQHTPLNALTGPMPKIDKAGKVLQRQSSSGMPIVTASDLAQAPGDRVRVDFAHLVKLRAIMGDENAQGQGASLDYSFQEYKIDAATIPVKLGGKMTQKRFQHKHYEIGINQLKGGIPAFEYQRCLVAMAGARGVQDTQEWILPLASDPRFAAQMVNPVQAPTYNRHYVVSGANLVQGGAQLGSILTTDLMTLDHVDRLSELLSEQVIRILNLEMPGDKYSGDDPILGVLMLDNLVFRRLIANVTLRQYQADAMKRAEFGGVKDHPLFSPGAFLWNNILVRNMGQYSIRFNGLDQVAHVAPANRYTAAETNVALPALAGFQVARSVFLGAQAVAKINGANEGSGYPYTMLEAWENFGRNREIAGEVIGSAAKIRSAFPDGSGNMEPTDVGAVVIDSVIPRMSV